MKKIFLISLAILALSACRKEAFEGPDLTDVYGEFEILDSLKVSVESVDFSTGASAFFTCKLSKFTNWKIEIEGESTGAVKVIEGGSRNLDASNASWDGSTTTFPVFREENCSVMLTFEGETDTLMSAITVTGVKNNDGFIVADFEDGWNPGWSKFVQSGANMRFDILDDSVAPHSDHYYNMQGTVNWDYLIGLVDFNAQAYGAATLPLTDNAEQLYFNVLVYGEKGLDNSFILFRFDEDDNGDGSFDEATEDQYGVEVYVTWEGWQMVSIKYSDLIGNGNGGDIHNPDKINKVSMLHLANPELGFAKTAIDFMIFTENEPARP